MSRRVLITGASGFIGKNLMAACLARGDEVQRLSSGGDRDRIREFKPQTVFHCAAYGVNPEQTGLLSMAGVNVEYVADLLRRCEAAGAEVFVNTGSAVEYGPNANYPDESTPCVPTTPYGITKLAGTLFAQAHKGQMRVVTLRLYTPFGWHEPDYRLIPQLIAAAKEKRFPKLSHPNNSRDFVWIEDVVQAYFAVERTSTAYGVYNVGSGFECTLRELAGRAKRMFDIPGEPEWGTAADRPIEQRYRANVERLTFDTAWRAQTPIGAALRKLYGATDSVHVPIPDYA